MEAVAGGVPTLLLPWLLFSWTTSPCQGDHHSHQNKEENVAMYPTYYPFETMPLVINRCKDVVKFFHNHHVSKALLQELQKTTGAQGLVQC
jgi:hypothetical protein